MDNSNSPLQKRLREINQISLSDNTPKLCRGTERESLYFNNTNSPLMFVQIMDKRFEKLSLQLQANVKTMFSEYEEHLLREID